MDKIELIFNIYKDKTLIAKRFKQEIIKKFALPERTITDLFVKIQNYQIAKYGTKLSFNRDVYTKEELRKINVYARSRKYLKTRTNA